MVAVVSQFGEVLRGCNAELANFRKGMNLRIPKGIIFVPVCVPRSCALSENRLDAFLAGQREAFFPRTLSSLTVESVGPIFLAVDVV
jgi:hypothetical protein